MKYSELLYNCILNSVFHIYAMSVSSSALLNILIQKYKKQFFSVNFKSVSTLNFYQLIVF